MTTFDPATWSAKVRGDDCALCTGLRTDDAGRIVAELASGRVLLQDDADFRGYCILVFRRHACELFELSYAERSALIEDVNRVAQAVQRVVQPAKLNYAMLGNMAPHLHVHVIPRFPGDGWWGQSIWARPDAARRTLPTEELAALGAALRATLAG